MFGNAKKHKPVRIDTLIGNHSEILGDIHFSGGLHIDGTVKGNVIAARDEKSKLSLSESGFIEGEVNVPYAALNGVVSGDVHGGEHIELSPKARITGTVYYNLIEMAIGAEVNGKLVRTVESQQDNRKEPALQPQGNEPGDILEEPVRSETLVPGDKIKVVYKNGDTAIGRVLRIESDMITFENKSGAVDLFYKQKDAPAVFRIDK